MPNGLATLPDWDPRVLTLGWGVIQHANRWLVQPNGPMAGRAWTPTDSQARWLLWWYALDESGGWLFHHGARRLAKGSGKSPFAGVQCLEELTGPVRLDHFDPDVRGGCVGKAVDMPLVQIAATAESQTANTMRMVRAMAQKKSRLVAEYHIEVGKTVFYTPVGGQLEIITSSASAAEGAEVTFAILDETEHWTPSSGGQELASTLDRNLAKSNSRGIETANAWSPGAGSVAESTFEAWRAQQEGRTRGTSQILYDARIAPPDTKLDDPDSLTAAIDFVYDDCFWVPQATIRERIWDTRTPEDVSRRFYLNQPTADDDAWTTPMLWGALAATDSRTWFGTFPKREIQDGEEIAAFFDGSRSNDATGIVGCAISDGHVFTIDVWEPALREKNWTVPVHEVDAAVGRMFERYQVMAFFCDVQEWQSYVRTSWPEEFGKQLLIHSVPTGQNAEVMAWDMRSKWWDFTKAAELTNAEIVERKFTHGGHPNGTDAMSRHVANARRWPNRAGISIGKESPKSSKKVDLAVCMIGARMARRRVLESTEWKKRKKGRGNRRIIFFDE